MAKATRTVKARIVERAHQHAWFVANHVLFNRVVAFYFEVIQAHEGVLDLPTKEALTALETLTHPTTHHPTPVMPLSHIQEAIPAMFRRAAINAALGSAKSFSSHLKAWRARKAKAQAKGKSFSGRPPVPPRTWNKSMPFYAGQWKDRDGSHIMLKLWTGACWSWVKVRFQERALPDGYEWGSPTLVRKGEQWRLHTPVEKTFPAPRKIAEQVTLSQETRICAVDLNLDKHLAVCTIQAVDGTTLATRFVGGGKRVSGCRKRLLGRIARKRAQTGRIAEGEQDNVALWRKIRHADEHIAHLVSTRIVEFARQHHATLLVFEHLGHLRPEKGTYSHRGNQKRAYWMKGRIFQYAKYKAWHAGVLTARVNPRNTSRECARCGANVVRYAQGQPEDGYTPGTPLVVCQECQMRGHADRNASLNIGQRLIARSQPPLQEKPPTRRVRSGRVSQETGVVLSQDTQSQKRPSLSQARYGERNGHGTAPEHASWMDEACFAIPTQLRLFSEEEPRSASSEGRLRRSGRSRRVSTRA